MSDNSNNRPNKPGTPPGGERKKAGPSVPTANRPTGQSGNATKTDAPIKPARPNQASTRPTTQMSARALSRYEKDLRRQRQLVWAVVGVIVFVLLVLAFGIWQTTLAPTFDTVAQVGSDNVSRAEYNKFRKLQIFKQIGALQQQAQFSQGDQQQQIQSQITLLQDEENHVSERPINQDTLEQLTNQHVLEKAAKDKFGITVSNDDVNNYLGQQFRDVIYTATPNATHAQQTATAGPVATQAAGFNTATAGAVTPLPTATPSVPATTTVASATGTPGATGAATVSGTAGATTPSLTPAPTAAGTPGTPAGTTGASPTVTPTAQPTATSTAIAADKVQATASANQSDYLKSYRQFTGLSDDDYRQLEIRPTLLKNKVLDKLRETQPKVGDPYPASHISHILVADEATAKQIYDQLKAAPADKLNDTFVELARTKSTDTTAASHNGDLGWVTDKTQFDQTFLDAALKLNKGEFSQPVKTQFGYHIIYCTDKDPKRPLDALTIEGFNQTDQNGDPKFFSDWLKDQAKAYNVKYNTPPTPAPTATLVPVPAFTPVVPPTATPLPTATSVPTTTVAATTAASGTPGATTAAGTTAASTTSAATTAAATTSSATTASSTTAASTTSAVTTAAATTPALTTTSSGTATPSPTR